ncbi:MAG: hypothetical protein AAGF01_20315 [Cyanobacteria bacterium P01_G01_bin.38]
MIGYGIILIVALCVVVFEIAPHHTILICDRTPHHQGSCLIIQVSPFRTKTTEVPVSALQCATVGSSAFVINGVLMTAYEILLIIENERPIKIKPVLFKNKREAALRAMQVNHFIDNPDEKQLEMTFNLENDSDD